MYMDWWSQFYKRPLKDPILQTYTIEELMYEYHTNKERKAAQSTVIEGDADKIEEAKEKADQEWADKMEQEEAREMAAKRAAAEKKKAEAEKKKAAEQQDPREDPENVEWMEQQIEKAKKEMGPEFGKDLKVSFED